MDGYYILLADARCTSPPQSQMWSRATDASWALNREHIRAGRCIIFHGPDPKEILLLFSKAQASDWAYDVLSERRKHIEQAGKSYFYRQMTTEESQFLLAEARNLLEFACVQIEQARQKPSQPERILMSSHLRWTILSQAITLLIIYWNLE